MIYNIIFVIVLIAAILFFYKNVRFISRNILLGRKISIKDNISKRWKLMLRVAIGQSKMVVRPVSGILHIFVYVGFIIVNIEMLEILVDGIAGTHRAFHFFGQLYYILVSSFEFFALSVIFACIFFLARRNIIRIKRFWSKEMTSWPRSDANIILITEILLMSAYLIMDSADGILQLRNHAHYINVGEFPASKLIQPLLAGLSTGTLIFIERFCWWFHIVGVLAFLNYIPYSKHFHVFLAFPNVFYSRFFPKGKFYNMPNVTKEVKLMLDDTAAAPSEEEGEQVETFGAQDVKDLTWKNLMDAYTCTECGRCTSSCPANITGKKLSPRKIVMDTRDRLHIVGKNIDKKGKDYEDNRSLFDFVSDEELWACTTCNACTEECPVNIEPMSIIIEMRRYLVMEKAAAPADINTIFRNIENNGAPWQFSPEDRLLWAEGMEIPVMADVFPQGNKPEYLFWVGSAGAFDDRYKKVVRAFTKILNHLNVSYAVLGTEESSSGDIARRTGNEMLFQMQAMMNIDLLKMYEVKKIITCDPHVYNTFKNEYPELGGEFEVIHHTMFLRDMINQGKLQLNGNTSGAGTVTFHDPCYLGRANNEYDAPREVLNATGCKAVEMKRNRSISLCCGAGGGQMFKEAEEGDKEIFIERTEEALQTGAGMIVTACPYCLVMMTDGLKYKNKEEELSVNDIAEIVVQAMNI